MEFSVEKSVEYQVVSAGLKKHGLDNSFNYAVPVIVKNQAYNPTLLKKTKNIGHIFLFSYKEGKMRVGDIGYYVFHEKKNIAKIHTTNLTGIFVRNTEKDGKDKKPTEVMPYEGMIAKSLSAANTDPLPKDLKVFSIEDGKWVSKILKQDERRDIIIFVDLDRIALAYLKKVLENVDGLVEEHKREVQILEDLWGFVKGVDTKNLEWVLKGDEVWGVVLGNIINKISRTTKIRARVTPEEKKEHLKKLPITPNMLTTEIFSEKYSESGDRDEAVLNFFNETKEIINKTLERVIEALASKKENQEIVSKIKERKEKISNAHINMLVSYLPTNQLLKILLGISKLFDIARKVVDKIMEEYGRVVEMVRNIRREVRGEEVSKEVLDDPKYQKLKEIFKDIVSLTRRVVEGEDVKEREEIVKLIKKKVHKFKNIEDVALSVMIRRYRIIRSTAIKFARSISLKLYSILYALKDLGEGDWERVREDVVRALKEGSEDTGLIEFVIKEVEEGVLEEVVDGVVGVVKEAKKLVKSIGEDVVKKDLLRIKEVLDAFSTGSLGDRDYESRFGGVEVWRVGSGLGPVANGGFAFVLKPREEEDIIRVYVCTAEIDTHQMMGRVYLKFLPLPKDTPEKIIQRALFMKTKRRTYNIKTKTRLQLLNTMGQLNEYLSVIRKKMAGEGREKTTTFGVVTEIKNRLGEVLDEFKKINKDNKEVQDVIKTLEGLLDNMKKAVYEYLRATANTLYVTSLLKNTIKGFPRNMLLMPYASVPKIGGAEIGALELGERSSVRVPFANTEGFEINQELLKVVLEQLRIISSSPVLSEREDVRTAVKILEEGRDIEDVFYKIAKTIEDEVYREAAEEFEKKRGRVTKNYSENLKKTIEFIRKHLGMLLEKEDVDKVVIDFINKNKDLEGLDDLIRNKRLLKKLKKVVTRIVNVAASVEDGRSEGKEIKKALNNLITEVKRSSADETALIVIYSAGDRLKDVINYYKLVGAGTRVSGINQVVLDLIVSTCLKKHLTDAQPSQADLPPL